MTQAPTPPAAPEFRPHEITRPHPRLMQYYLLTSLLTGPLAPFVLLPMFFRYYTLRYEFDDRGVSMKWGILFRREVLLTYRRIQDIHLTRNIVQRWLGLATVSLQTAAGSSNAEMAIEGILEADQLRDFLYSKMRGARGETDRHEDAGSASEVDSPDKNVDEPLVLLREIRDSLAKMAARREGSA